MRGKCRTGRRTTRGRLLTRRTGGCRWRSESEKERSAATMAWRITPKEYSPIRFSILSPEFSGRGYGDAESSVQNRPVARNSVIADLRPPARNPSVKSLGLLREDVESSQENSRPAGATVAVPPAAQTESWPMARGPPPRKRREYGRKHAVRRKAVLSRISRLGVGTRMLGSPAWIRTTIHGSKGRCPTIRRPGNASTDRI